MAAPSGMEPFMAPFLAPLAPNISVPFAPPIEPVPFASPVNSTAPQQSAEDLAWDISSQVIGWLYFVAWSISFYPQVWTNWRKKSVAGFSIDYQVLNIQGYVCYTIFNSVMFFSTVIQQQYFLDHNTNVVPSTASDVAFGAHGLLMCTILAIQSFIYERGGQTVSKLTYLYTGLIWTAIVVVGILVGTNVLILLWLIQAFGFVKMSITLVKYTPQVYLNWKRKSTEGFSLPGVLLDISGGLLSFLQMFLMSFHSGKWDQFQGGNIPKFGLSVLTIFFDMIFVVQEYMYKPRPGKQHANGYVGLEDEPINASAYPLDSERKSYGAV